MDLIFFELKNFFKSFFARNLYKTEVGVTSLYFRPRSIFEIYTIYEIFVRNDYRVRFNIKKPIKTIIDLGANIGIFAVWAGKQFNPKTIIAVEMNNDNRTIIKRNVRANKISEITHLVNAAVYDKKTPWVVKHRSPLGSIMDTVKVSGNGKRVKTISFDKVLALAGTKIVDFLKIDIEGSEKHIFTNEYRNLFKKRVRYIAMESHDLMGFNSKLPIAYLQDLGFQVITERALSLYQDNYLIFASNKSLN